MTRRSAIFAILSAAFFMSFFYRTTPAVIAPYLSQEFSLGAARLGLLSSIFFYVFAAFQIPLGPLLDKLGPRLMIATLAAVGAAGSLLFAIAPSFNLCLLGRGLMGLGMSCMYIGPLAVIAIWYPPRSFASMVGLLTALGNTGALIATLPLAILVEGIGWRHAFLIVAGVTLVLAFLVWLIVRDHPAPDATPASVGSAEGGNPAAATAVEKWPIFSVFRLIFANPSFWAIAGLNFFTTGSFSAILGLWGGPFLMDVFAMSPAGAGKFLSILSIGYITGNPLVGLLSDRMGTSRKKMTIAGLALYLLPLTLLCTVVRGPATSFLLYPVYFAIGFFAATNILPWTHLKELFPRRIIGTALTCSNFFAISGAAVLQYLMGVIIERYPAVDRVYPPEAYRDAFLLLLVGMAIAILFYWKVAREKREP
jgi:sugar phosphate permease